ncbi:titin homolog [Thalassophryne amazonica]|uniref:titin homolog n=1 Tax=Thalassophryne amazonica TaxID=390379 RepID=UPI001471B632|nr:titin homolog [Thalassophryne amazonica]
MAAQVEIQSGNVGRTVVGRLHFSPLTDSSNMSPIEIPSNNQLVISAEPSKPPPGPKPLLSPKPFSLEKSSSIKPILAPKPQTKPRPESTLLAGYKPEPSSTSKPQPSVVTDKLRPVSTNLNRPAPTSFKPSLLITGQTTKPVAQPVKPGPSTDTEKPATLLPADGHKPGKSHLAKSPVKAPAAEWPGTTKNEVQDHKKSSSGVTSITRAKSMGFLMQMSQEEKDKQKPDGAVPMRPQPRSSRSRPVSAIYFAPPPFNTDSPVPASRWIGRQPLSADLTSKFESIGLSLHHRSPTVKPKEKSPLAEKEQNLKGTIPEDGGAKLTVPDQGNKKTEELGARPLEEDKCGLSVKRRISLLLDSLPSPAEVDSGQGSSPHTGVELVPETEPQLGVKQLIKQLTEDTTQTQSPPEKPAPKPRPLPRNLTKRFSAERTLDHGLHEVMDPPESSTEPQRKVDESSSFSSDQVMLVDTKDSHDQSMKASMFVEYVDGLAVDSTVKDSGPSSQVQTVRASMFENVVERHSVLMMEEGKHVNMDKDVSLPPTNKGSINEEGTLVTAVYKEPVSPPGPLQIMHSFDTVQAVEGSKAVSESVPSAQWEDKFMTLRARRSERNSPAAESSSPAPAEDALAMLKEQQPRYLRVGALQKWKTADLNQEAGLNREKLKEAEKMKQVILENRGQWETEQEEVAAAPKRLKMLQPEEHLKPKETYFALTGQIQELGSPVDVGRDVSLQFEDFSVRTVSSQGKSAPFRRNPSLDEALRTNAHIQVESLTTRSHKSDRETGSVLDRQMTEGVLGIEKKKECKKNIQKGRVKELEKETLKELEMKRQAHAEFARMKELEMQREFERRQKAFEKEKRELEESERQKQLDNEKRQELEKEHVRERQQQLERQQELEKQKEMEREKRRWLEKERQHEQKRQRELDKARQVLEIQKERQKMEDMERRRKQKEKERQQLAEQRLKEEAEKQKQLAVQQELERLKEIEREREMEKERLKEMEREKERQREMEKERLKEMEREKERQREMEKERLKEMEREKERQREMEKERLKEIEWEKQKEAERLKQRDLERERQKQLDIVRQQLEYQKMRQQELEKEKWHKEELEMYKEMEKRKLLEFEQQKRELTEQQVEELEKWKLKEKMQREEAEKMRQVAKLQEAERQRLKEKQQMEAQERRMLDLSLFRPKVVDLDSVLRDDMFSKTPSQRSDSAPRWKEASPRVQQSYKPAILDIDSFTSLSQTSQMKEVMPVSGIQGREMGNGSRIQSAPAERDTSQKVPSQSLMGFPSSTCAPPCHDPWELVSSELLVDSPVGGHEPPKKHFTTSTLEQLLSKQEERLLAQQRTSSASQCKQSDMTSFSTTEVKFASHPDGGSSKISAEPSWLSAEPSWLSAEPELQDSRKELLPPQRSQGSQELTRMRSRSVSRRSVPLNNSVEGSLFRMRSRSAHREQEHQRWVSSASQHQWKPTRGQDFLKMSLLYCFLA